MYLLSSADYVAQVYQNSNVIIIRLTSSLETGSSRYENFHNYQYRATVSVVVSSKVLDINDR